MSESMQGSAQDFIATVGRVTDTQLKAFQAAMDRVMQSNGFCRMRILPMNGLRFGVLGGEPFMTPDAADQCEAMGNRGFADHECN